MAEHFGTHNGGEGIPGGDGDVRPEGQRSVENRDGQPPDKDRRPEARSPQEQAGESDPGRREHR